MELCEYTCWELHNMLKRKEISAWEITRSVIKRIEEVDGRINSYITKTFNLALKVAHKVDDKIRRGEEIHPLSGIPIAIKDNICIEGVRTTCGSRMLSNFIPPYDATVIERLKARDAVFIGKTNMDEFAMGSSTETSYFGVTCNPWDLERIPGGSSGGSCTAVATNCAILALGSDTGGSIRQPASMCGVVGLKPTYGRVSRFGLIAYASSLDQIGPITKDVRDCALLLSAISGHDTKDSTSVKLEVPDYTKSLVEGLEGVKIGIPREYFGEGLDREVKERVLDGVKLLCSLGAEVEETHLPYTEYAIATYYLIATSEASSNLARYDGVEYGYRAEEKGLIDMYRYTRSIGFGQEVKRRIMLGTYSLSSGYYDAYYLKALKVRTLIKRDFEEAFKKFTCLITPTSPTPAFYIGEKIDDPLTMYLQDIYTISTNLAGIPALSIPCGFKDGLPIGMQIQAPSFGEEILLRIAYNFEKNTDYHNQKPKI